MKKGIKRVCPSCGGRKDFYALSCRPCSPKPTGCAGLTGAAHPAWKGGTQIDRDGYVRTYAPAHPWPRLGGYVLEHVRIMELAIGRRIVKGEVVHHLDHDRSNNAIDNLQLLGAGQHSREHRRLDSHLRNRDAHGRFAGNGVPNA